MEWVKGFAPGIGYRTFHVMVGGLKTITLTCRKNIAISGEPWDLAISGWDIPNYNFKWYKRFHQKDILAKTEDIILNVNAAKLVIFNRIFEGPK